MTREDLKKLAITTAGLYAPNLLNNGGVDRFTEALIAAYNAGVEAAAADCEKHIWGEGAHDEIRKLKIGEAS